MAKPFFLNESFLSKINSTITCELSHYLKNPGTGAHNLCARSLLDIKTESVVGSVYCSSTAKKFLKHSKTAELPLTISSFPFKM